jgi:hypothetical protein
MNRPILACALYIAASAGLAAQTSQPNPYAGTSNPPPDDQITEPTAVDPAPPAKPPAAHYAQPAAQPSADVQPNPDGAPAPAYDQPAAAGNPALSGDNGTVEVAPDARLQPRLNQRTYSSDPDGDIVHPELALAPGEVGGGTTIRVRLLDRLSTAMNERGDVFHTQVATDVMQGGQVLIPAGAHIDGRVVEVSAGHAGGHGSMRLRPETVILADGRRFRIYAETSGAPGSGTRVGTEGMIAPGSRVKRDSIEYGGAVGAGAITGAVVAGPAGALAGTLIGAGAVTVHLLVSHPQATLESGTTLLFTLTEPLNLMAVPDAAPPVAEVQPRPAGN